MPRPSTRSAPLKRTEHTDEPPRVLPCSRIVEYADAARRRFALIPLPADVPARPEIPAADGTMLHFVRELPAGDVSAEIAADARRVAHDARVRHDALLEQIACLSYGAAL